MSRVSILAISVVALCGCDSPPTPTPAAEAPSSMVSGARPAPSSTAAVSATAATTAALAPSHGASAVPAASSTAIPSAAQKTSCAPGAYLHNSPRFCLVAPAGYVPAKVKSGDVIAAVLFRSDAPGTMDLEVSWAKQPRSAYLEERKDYEEAAKVDANALIGKTRAGKGLYVRFRRKQGGSEIAVGQSVLYSKGTIIWCKAQAFAKPKPPEGFLTACQTLMAR